MFPIYPVCQLLYTVHLGSSIIGLLYDMKCLQFNILNGQVIFIYFSLFKTVWFSSKSGLEQLKPLVIHLYATRPGGFSIEIFSFSPQYAMRVVNVPKPHLGLD